VAAGMVVRCQLFKHGCLDVDSAKACPSVLVLKSVVDFDVAHVCEIGGVQAKQAQARAAGSRDECGIPRWRVSPASGTGSNCRKWPFSGPSGGLARAALFFFDTG
jgi:hypothetical protein